MLTFLTKVQKDILKYVYSNTVQGVTRDDVILALYSDNSSNTEVMVENTLMDLWGKGLIDEDVELSDDCFLLMKYFCTPKGEKKASKLK